MFIPTCKVDHIPFLVNNCVIQYPTWPNYSSSPKKGPTVLDYRSRDIGFLVVDEEERRGAQNQRKVTVCIESRLKAVNWSDQHFNRDASFCASLLLFSDVNENNADVFLDLTIYLSYNCYFLFPDERSLSAFFGHRFGFEASRLLAQFFSAS